MCEKLIDHPFAFHSEAANSAVLLGRSAAPSAGISDFCSHYSRQISVHNRKDMKFDPHWPMYSKIVCKSVFCLFCFHQEFHQMSKQL
jgi:hypothetical protein